MVSVYGFVKGVMSLRNTKQLSQSPVPEVRIQKQVNLILKPVLVTSGQLPPGIMGAEPAYMGPTVRYLTICGL